MTENPWQARFTDLFTRPASSAHDRVWAEVYGDQYPTGLGTHSYLSIQELNQITAEVALNPGDLLVDVGCGRGGPGLWVASHRNSRLIGIDIAETALHEARQRATALSNTDTTDDRPSTSNHQPDTSNHKPATFDFRLGTFADTGLPTASAQAIMSVDALLFAPDKPAALTELARILAPSGRLVLTTWDYTRQPIGRPPQLPDHRPALTAAGFNVLTYDETDDWRHRQTRTTDLMLDATDEIAAETGSDPAEIRSSLLEMRATIDCMSRRVLIVAERSSA